MDGPELWLMIVSVTLVVIAVVAHVVPTRKHRDTTAYWQRKIRENGKRQQWGGR